MRAWFADMRDILTDREIFWLFKPFLMITWTSLFIFMGLNELLIRPRMVLTDLLSKPWKN